MKRLYSRVALKFASPQLHAINQRFDAIGEQLERMPQLDDLRETHLAILDAMSALSAAITRLERRIDELEQGK